MALPDPLVADPAVQRNFDALDQLLTVTRETVDAIEPVDLSTVLALADPGAPAKVAFGTVSFTFPGSSLSDIETVTHGLGITPTVVLAMAREAGGADVVAVSSVDEGATTFRLRARTVNGAAVGPGEVVGFWIAIGLVS